MAVAALLVVAAVVTAVQYGRLPSGPAAPPARPDDPPAGVPVFYVRDGVRAHTIVAYDWTGVRRGSLDFPVWVDVSRLRPAADGSGFILDPAFSGDYAAYFDRLGYVLSEDDSESFIAQAWASDDSSVCVLSTEGPERVVATRSANGVQRAVRISGADFSVGPVEFDACNVKSGVAVLQVQVDGNSWRVTAVSLSSGAVSGAADAAAGPALVSHDAAYVAIGQRVYRASDMSTAIGLVGEPLTPVAFSGDDSSMLVIAGTHLVVVDWKTGRQLWTYEAGSSQFGPWLARPRAAGDFAIAVRDADAARPDVVIAHRDGTTTVVSSREPIAW